MTRTMKEQLRAFAIIITALVALAAVSAVGHAYHPSETDDAVRFGGMM
ncbi:hypothetical protein [Methylobacterium oxalidis]|uniref:Uncharacterized protein n=1 Tax=Methylobacterium oxalidis TaxID=944322 RepID=A0A512J985_9HYPH|nr:hypothetical protein [Methylobacterium oxalidis]GEP06534.1 hypothetical protein MOX02_45720 [Methylobacterium oxalidis]GJE30731.1 hypothetical protein LDDCCGHA_0900 [Methylobacterium oxalidis]GLS63888.1 hypothetical protein GCM10007888_22690 [Methylobacterium oxalidis]